MNAPHPNDGAMHAKADAGEPLVRVEHLTKSYDVSGNWLGRLLHGGPRRYLKAVEDVSFTIERGRTLSLVGESGCGKSTVARCIAGLHGKTAGAIYYKDVEIAEIAAGRSPYRRELQMIFQDPYGSLNPRWRVGRIIADPILALGLARSRAEVAAQVAGLLEAVGLAADDADRYPHEFSGGQRQRIAIARALSSRPNFIICDEPTSALDVSVQAQILNLMSDLQDELRLTYLFISHNLAVVEQMSDRVGVMYLGRIVEIADAGQLFQRPLHPYTRLLIEAMPVPDRIGMRHEPMKGEVPDPINPPSGCAFHPRCPFAVERCARERPELRRFRATSAACHRVEELTGEHELA